MYIYEINENNKILKMDVRFIEYNWAQVLKLCLWTCQCILFDIYSRFYKGYFSPNQVLLARKLWFLPPYF